MTLTLLPPLVINTSLGFLLFTSHSFFSLSLAKLSFFKHERFDEEKSVLPLPIADESQARDGDQEDPINLHTLLTGPSTVPRHPTLLSAIAGAGAGVVQGMAFTPVENLVRCVPGEIGAE